MTQPTSNNNTELMEYRKTLIAADQKSQEAFDKAVLSLSGGALGISFVFLNDVIGSNPLHKPYLLLAAWILWAASSLAVLFSYYLSHLALRRAIKQVDTDEIYKELAGGKFSKATAYLNISGAILFFLGICVITGFASANLSNRGNSNAGEKTAKHTATEPKTSTSPTTTTGQKRTSP